MTCENSKRISRLLESDFHIIIQARMTSTRLPKKVMLPLCSKPVLAVMIDRLAAFKEKLIIATTNDGTQKPIVDLCRQLGVKYVEGDTNNVLSRYYLAAQSVKASPETVIVRCTSDCPLIDINETAKVIEYFMNVKSQYDYVSAGPHCGFPNGFDTEVFTFKALQIAFENASQDFEKEHMTQYICNHLKVADYAYAEDLSHWRLTLDEPDDYNMIKAVYELFENRTDFDFSQLKNALQKNNEILLMNQHIEQVKVG